MSKENVKQAINETIASNGKRGISAQSLSNVLNLMVDEGGAGGGGADHGEYEFTAARLGGDGAYQHHAQTVDAPGLAAGAEGQNPFFVRDSHGVRQNVGIQPGQLSLGPQLFPVGNTADHLAAVVGDLVNFGFILQCHSALGGTRIIQKGTYLTFGDSRRCDVESAGAKGEDFFFLRHSIGFPFFGVADRRVTRGLRWRTLPG